jgi:hypothetical protein
VRDVGLWDGMKGAAPGRKKRVASAIGRQFSHGLERALGLVRESKAKEERAGTRTWPEETETRQLLLVAL